LENERGPELAYYVGEHPEIWDRLNGLSAAGAVTEIGRIAERLTQRAETHDAVGREHLSVNIPASMVADYQRKALELHKSDPLSQEEIGIAWAVGVAPHVTHTVIALGRPDLARHLIRNISLVGKLNNMHPLAAAGELAHIAHQLDSEASDSTERRAAVQVPAPIRPVRKPSPTSTGLSDSLPIEEWVKRREAQLRK
jgi:hypothetical protein